MQVVRHQKTGKFYFFIGREILKIELRLEYLEKSYCKIISKEPTNSQRSVTIDLSPREFLNLEPLLNPKFFKCVQYSNVKTKTTIKIWTPCTK